MNHEALQVTMLYSYCLPSRQQVLSQNKPRTILSSLKENKNNKQQHANYYQLVRKSKQDYRKKCKKIQNKNSQSITHI